MDDTDLRELAQRLNSSAIHLLRAASMVDRASGLTAARLSALSVLVYGGPQTLSGLARAEGVTAPTMTRIVDALADLGLATRQPHPDSARLVRIEATRQGRKQMNQARAARLGVLAAALAGLPAADRRRLRDAAPLLDRLASLIAQPPVAALHPPTRRR